MMKGIILDTSWMANTPADHCGGSTGKADADLSSTQRIREDMMMARTTAKCPRGKSRESKNRSPAVRHNGTFSSAFPEDSAIDPGYGYPARGNMTAYMSQGRQFSRQELPVPMRVSSKAMRTKGIEPIYFDNL